MKKFFIVVLGLTVFQFVIAAPPGKLQEPAMQKRNALILDQCMDEYNVMNVLLEAEFNGTVQLCYNVFQFPYNLHCHGQAIQIWSFYQDQLFEDLVSCQNGNLARPKKEGTK